MSNKNFPAGHKPNCNCPICLNLRTQDHDKNCNCKDCNLNFKKFRGNNHPKRGKKYPNLCGEGNPAKRPEVRKKISESKMGNNNCMKDPEIAKKAGLGIKLAWQDPDFRKNMEEKVHKNPEYLKNMSSKLTQKWKDPEFQEKQKQSRKGDSPNKPETFLMNFLNQIMPNQWQYVGNNQLRIDGLCPDFVHVSKPLVIELFGDYWHGEKFTKQTNVEHMLERVHRLQNEQYQTLIIWEEDLKHPKFLERSILNFCKCDKPKLYFSHPMRGKKGNTEEGNIDHKYQNENSNNAVLNVYWLREMFPQIEFYCPGEVEIPVQTMYQLGYVTVEQILIMDQIIIEKRCCGTLVHKWEDSVGADIELKRTKELGYPYLVFTESKNIWDCPWKKIKNLVNKAMIKHEELSREA